MTVLKISLESYDSLVINPIMIGLNIKKKQKSLVLMGNFKYFYWLLFFSLYLKFITSNHLKIKLTLIFNL